MRGFRAILLLTGWMAWVPAARTAAFSTLEPSAQHQLCERVLKDSTLPFAPAVVQALLREIYPEFYRYFKKFEADLKKPPNP